ncbi:MAG: glycosyltransferase [Acidobacteriota bacterium]
MTRFFVCGLCPLPFENTTRSFGPGIRTWQMARVLADAGHDVHLLAMCIPGAYGEGEQPADGVVEGVQIERIEAEEFFQLDAIRRRLDAFQPEAVVGATMYGSYILGNQWPQVPFWADQFGDVMAEGQAKAFLDESNWAVAHFWNILEPILHRCDRLSVVSERQRWAAVGQLGAMGRLVHETCGYEFTSVMPCALIPAEPVTPKPMLRGSTMPDDAFVALWSGGYNVWSDVETLFRGVEQAMAADPRIHFVSTGGEIGGHDEATYRHFEEAIAASTFRDRFHLQGWIKAELVPHFQAEADVGVLCERPLYEGQLGSKNRIVQWLGGGLPVIYNRVGDLGELLEERDIGWTFPQGDSDAFADRLLAAAAADGDPSSSVLDEMIERGRRYALGELTFEATTRELVAWANEPTRAPDAHWRETVVRPRDFSSEAMPTSEVGPVEAVAEDSPLDAAAQPAATSEPTDASEAPRPSLLRRAARKVLRTIRG